MLATAWYVIRYYIRCLRLASTGALDKANAWSWILGIIPLALAGWYWDIGALRIPDTPRDFIVFMVVTVVLSLMLVFLVRLVFAPAILAQELEKDRDELRGQLVPKINFFWRDWDRAVQFPSRLPRAVRIPNGYNWQYHAKLERRWFKPRFGLRA
jgi:hypothetical protein